LCFSVLSTVALLTSETILNSVLRELAYKTGSKNLAVKKSKSGFGFYMGDDDEAAGRVFEESKKQKREQWAYWYNRVEKTISKFIKGLKRIEINVFKFK